MLYGPLLYRWGRRAGLQDADAADVGSRVFEVVIRKIGSFDRTQPGATLRGWLRRITMNTISDLIQKAPPGGTGVGGYDGDAVLESLQAHETDRSHDAEDQALLLQRALEIIRGDYEEKTWQAFLRQVMDERPAAEVAAELQISRNAAYLAVARIKRRLRHEFEGLLDL